jgi:hemerythrin-like metal-binding protein
MVWMLLLLNYPPPGLSGKAMVSDLRQWKTNAVAIALSSTLENRTMTKPILQWSDALCLEMPLMDITHQEFVALLAKVMLAPDARLPAAWDDLIDHTQAHFDQEDRWMAETGFAAGNCHATQHKIILQVMREGAQCGRAGDLALVREMAHELGLWFPQHAQSMDASLALHLRSSGYDLVTGAVAQPQALPVSRIQGCGSSTCGDAGVKLPSAREIELLV